MKIKKFLFIRDIVQSPEWQDFSRGFDDHKQLNVLEDWFVLYESKYEVHGYNALQFQEEFLQVHHG